MSEIDELRQSLRKLSQRLANGEIDGATFGRLREKLLADVPPGDRAQLGLAPASSAPGPTPHPVTPASFGPSGGRGRGLATRVVSLSDLDLTPGTTLFDQWRIVRELGRGGFGVVVEAEELTLRERQALKVLDPAMLSREDLLERFRREVKATRRLVHPRIVRVFDYRENLPEGLALFSMEYVAGCNVQGLLAAAREKRVRVPVPLALSILEEVLEALEAAHAQGVIHRDVTPANILLAGGAAFALLAAPGADPGVKLVDFGIAGALNRSELSQQSRILGTAAYVAPEVLDSRCEVGTAADVYGAGAVFYELLTGVPPLGRFEDPSKLRPELGPALDLLALSMLQRHPNRRPSAPEAREAAGVTRREGAGDRSVPREVSREERSPFPPPPSPPSSRSPALSPSPGPSPSRSTSPPASPQRPPPDTPMPAAPSVRSRAPVRPAPPSPAAAPPFAAANSPRRSLVPGLIGGGALLVLLAGILAMVSGSESAAPSDNGRGRASAAPLPPISSTPTPVPLPTSMPVDLSEYQLPSPESEQTTPSPGSVAGLREEFRWVTIPAGSFTMGCTSGDRDCLDEEKPRHKVSLTKTIRMAATETTNAQYRVCVEAGVCSPPSNRTGLDDPSTGDHPVVHVSWGDAEAFCRWVGNGWLPSEAEWEYAARGDKEGSPFPWWRDTPARDAANLEGTGGGDEWEGTGPVGAFAPNGFGLFDMAGNAEEWCADWYGLDYFAKSPGVDPPGPPWGEGRVVRGGAWNDAESALRVSSRRGLDPASGTARTGFRCAADPLPR